jgi:hypothetical protein
MLGPSSTFRLKLTLGKLIETGKALRAADKDGGRTIAASSTRLRSTIPSAIENFHQALDELECDIVRNYQISSS